MARNARTVLTMSIAIATVAAAAVAAYRYAHAPGYALNKLARAMTAHDTATVHEYLDVQATSTQIVNAVVESATASTMMEASNEGNGFAAMGAAIGSLMIDRMKPALATMLRATIDSAIATPDMRYLAPANSQRQPSVAAAPGAMRSAVAQIRDREMQLERVGTTRQFRDSATVDLHIRHESFDTTLALNVAMRRTGGLWRVVGLVNVGTYLKSLEAVEAKRLEVKNSPIIARLRQMAPVGKLEVAHQSAGYFSEYLRLRAAVRNDSRDTIVVLFFKLDGPTVSVGGGSVALLHSEEKGPIAPGVTAAVDGLIEYNRFLDGQNTLRYSPEQFAPRLVLAVTRNGTARDTITPYETWADYRRRGAAAYMGR
jgi:hypothetical protein